MLEAGHKAIAEGHNQVSSRRSHATATLPHCCASLLLSAPGNRVCVCHVSLVVLSFLAVAVQYTRTAGHPDLVGLLAERYSRHMNRSIDAMTEVAVTVGASQVRCDTVSFNVCCHDVLSSLAHTLSVCATGCRPTLCWTLIGPRVPHAYALHA